MTRPHVPNRMKYEQVEKLYRALTPDERLIVNDHLGLTFKSDLDKVYDAFERLSDEDRVRFVEMQDEDYCPDCGEPLGEDEHDCANADDGEDEDDEDHRDGDSADEDDESDEYDESDEDDEDEEDDDAEDDDEGDDERSDDVDDEDGFDDTQG